MGVMILWVATCCLTILSMLVMFIVSPIADIVLLIIAVVTSIVARFKTTRAVQGGLYALALAVGVYQLYQIFHAIVRAYS